MRAIQRPNFLTMTALLAMAGAPLAARAQGVAGPPEPGALPAAVAREQDRYDVFLVRDTGEHRAVVQLREGRVVAAEFDGRRLEPSDVRVEGRSLVLHDAGTPVAAFRVPWGLLETDATPDAGDDAWSPPPAAPSAQGLGLTVARAEPEDLRLSNYREGVLVTRVRERSAADLAGLKEGDIIVSLDGEPVRDPDELRRRVREREIDTAVRVTFLRDSQQQWTTLRIGELPNRPYAIQRPDDLGPESDWRPDARRMLGIGFEPVGREALEDVPEYDRGLRIGDLTRDGPADRAGLREGDILVGVGRAPVGSEEDLREALREAPIGQSVRLRVVREGTVFNVPVEPSRAGGQAPPVREPVELERTLGIRGSWADERAIGGARDWESGVLVESVAGGSAAERMGLRRGDVIVALDDEPMPTPERLAQRLAELDRSRPVRVTYVRSGEERIARFSLR